MNDCPKLLELEIQKRMLAENALAEKQKQYDRLKAQLEKNAVSDSVTGVFNRLKMDSIIENELQRCKRYNSRMSLILVSLDNLRNIYEGTDRRVINTIMRKFASAINGVLRNTDIIARWEGERFLVLLIETITGAVSLTERISNLIRETDLKGHTGLTCSFGLTGYKDDDNYISLIGRVESAYREASDLGGNKVVIS